MRRHALITGGSAGLGLETAKLLVTRGFDVTVTGRNSDRLDNAVRTLNRIQPGSAVGHRLNLGSLNDVSDSAESLSGRPIDVLVANAGAKIESPAKATADGFEWHIGVNHLAHFSLVAHLWPTLTPSARVVAVASIVARRGLETMMDDPRTLSIEVGTAYASSKLANLMFAMELNERCKDAGLGISASAAHPGFARASAYGSKLIRFGEYVAAQSAARGALPIVAAVDAPAGQYLGPGIFELWGKPILATVPALATDRPLRARVWQLTEEALGQKLLS